MSTRGKGPSATQLKALLMANQGDNPCLYRKDGGFWLGCATPSHNTGVPVEYVDIQTVRACERRGWLTRKHQHREEWRDERVLTDAGRALIGGAP